MHLLVATEAHFRQTSDGVAYSDTGGRGYSFWARYLDVFDSVTVIGRLSPQRGFLSTPVEGPGISLVPLEGYTGPEQLLWRLKRLKHQVRSACACEAAVIARAPGMVATLVLNELEKQRVYALEVVGDPYDAFGPGTVKHPLRPFFRRWFTYQLRRQCARASAVSYVTARALQHRYPPAPTAFSTHYSSVELPDYAFLSSPRSFQDMGRKVRLITVSMLGHLYKSPDVLIDALSICTRANLNLDLTVVGEGRYRTKLMHQAMALGLTDRVHFRGLLPAGDVVRAQLDQAHLFILPSRQEGLPRALIEAMARALPCIGSTVGGIPELLRPEDMVPPGDAVALAHKIQEVLGSIERMARMSARNLEKSREYRESLLRERRSSFYRHVLERTIEWAESRKL